MRDNFEQAFSAVIKHEGGYVDHPKDPGGATNLGVTIGTLSGWLGRPATKAEVRALTLATVKPIYKKNYWDRIRGDDLPAGLDYAVFDYAVNSGPSRAAISLQTIVGAAPDGKIGPLTLQNIAKGDPRTTIGDLCSQRLAFLERLSTWPTFGKGWRARVNGVRDLALQMANAGPITPPKLQPAPTPEPIQVEPAPASTSRSFPWGFIILLVFVLAIVGAFFVVRF